MTTAVLSTTPAHPPTDAFGLSTFDDLYDVCLAERDQQLEADVRAEIADYMSTRTDNGTEAFDAPEPAPSRFVEFNDKVRRSIRFTRCRFIAMTTRWSSRSLKRAPEKTIELTKNMKSQIWRGEVNCSVDWNKVMFDQRTYAQFTKVIRRMPTKRRRWFRQRFCYAGVV